MYTNLPGFFYVIDRIKWPLLLGTPSVKKLTWAMS
jgi:hypothetical protein